MFGIDRLKNTSNRLQFVVGAPDCLISRLKCSLCNDLFIEPTQTVCGCRFCFQCINDHLEGNKDCPNCNEKIDKEALLKDRAIEREIYTLKLKCINNECDYICTIKELNEHLKKCNFRVEQCHKCNESYLFLDSQNHLLNVCINAIVKCPDCNVEMTRNELQGVHKNIDHLDTLCRKWRDACPYKCGQEMHEDLATHLILCAERPIECNMKTFGCDFVGKSASIVQHMAASATQHSQMMANGLIQLQRENEHWKEVNASQQRIFTDEINEWKKANLELTNEVRKLTSALDDNRIAIATINSEIDKYRILMGVGNSLAVQPSDIAIVHSGTCVWIVRDIQQKIYDARSGSHVQIMSESFYLYRPGYKMGLKIYPNGDGQGKNKYLSIYFVIMKGDFDNEVAWPFKQKVTLTLESSHDSCRNVTVHMRPDNNGLCYGKPTNESNIGAGQPEFVRISDLLNDDRYTHRGTLKLIFSIELPVAPANNSPFVLETLKKIK